MKKESRGGQGGWGPEGRGGGVLKLIDKMEMMSAALDLTFIRLLGLVYLSFELLGHADWGSMKGLEARPRQNERPLQGANGSSRSVYPPTSPYAWGRAMPLHLCKNTRGARVA